MSRPHKQNIIVGIGNPYRGDDAVGLVVARRLRQRAVDGVCVVENCGDVLGLIELWTGSGKTVVVDAVQSGATPGSICRFDLREGVPSFCSFWASTHAFDLGDAVRLAAQLGRLPRRLVFYGVEGQCFEPGNRLTERVASAAEALQGQLLREIDADQEA